MKKSKISKQQQIMLQVYAKIKEQDLEGKELQEITYYKEFAFQDANLMDRNIYVVKLQKDKEKNGEIIYQIYDENSQIIATVNVERKNSIYARIFRKFKRN